MTKKTKYNMKSLKNNVEEINNKTQQKSSETKTEPLIIIDDTTNSQISFTKYYFISK